MSHLGISNEGDGEIVKVTVYRPEARRIPHVAEAFAKNVFITQYLAELIADQGSVSARVKQSEFRERLPPYPTLDGERGWIRPLNASDRNTDPLRDAQRGSTRCPSGARRPISK